ncbi:uncharacterized protein [Miscanthus floridulus]|uniref:uncharacterized protein n=1 Tax=Miscanthus floridulus TaxID=154761 RepID=UPI00345A22D6
MELRGSLGLLETARDATRFKLHGTQQLVAGLRVELVDEHGKALQLEEEAKKARGECDRLWKELQAKTKVSVEGQAALAKRGQELDATRVELQRLVASAEKASVALLPPPPPERGHDLTERCAFLQCTFRELLGARSAKGPAPP